MTRTQLEGIRYAEGSTSP